MVIVLTFFVFQETVVPIWYQFQKERERERERDGRSNPDIVVGGYSLEARKLLRVMLSFPLVSFPSLCAKVVFVGWLVFGGFRGNAVQGFLA